MEYFLAITAVANTLLSYLLFKELRATVLKDLRYLEHILAICKQLTKLTESMRENKKDDDDDWWKK